MVAPVKVGPVSDSFVRIAHKNNVQIIQADITQSLVENDNNINSPINRQIEDLVANQIRQTRFGSNRLSASFVFNQQPLQADNNQNETSSSLQGKNTNGQSVPNRIIVATNVAQEIARERRELIQTLPRSLQHSTVVRIRSKMSLTERAQFRPATENQQVQLIKKLENDVNNLKTDQMDLKRKLSLFQDLFQNRQKLDKVLKMLDENKKM